MEEKTLVEEARIKKEKEEKTKPLKINEKSTEVITIDETEEHPERRETTHLPKKALEVKAIPRPELKITEPITTRPKFGEKPEIEKKGRSHLLKHQPPVFTHIVPEPVQEIKPKAVQMVTIREIIDRDRERLILQSKKRPYVLEPIEIRKIEIIEIPEILIEPEDTVDRSVKKIREGGIGEPDILSELFGLEKEEFNWEADKKLSVIIATGESDDGMRMLEEIIARKYGYHGNFTFEQDLMFDATSFEDFEDIVEPRKVNILDKLDSDKLIVSGIISRVDWKNLIKKLRDLAFKVKKCIILYSRDNPMEICFEIRKIQNVELKVVKLPIWCENTCDLIGKLLGISGQELFETIEPWEGIENRVDHAFIIGWDMYEQQRKEIEEDKDIKDDLEKWLDWSIGHYFYKNRESKHHFLTKRFVCWLLKKDNPDKKIMMEVPIGEDRPIEQGEEIGKKIVPDITLDGEYWEIEIGYPSKIELEKNQQESDPYVHLMKLNKYPKNSEVKVVLPNIYAYLFRKQILKVKEDLSKDIKLKFYVIDWSKRELRRFA
jgi:hypothetical protein